MSDDAISRNDNRSTTPHNSAFTGYISGDWADVDQPVAMERVQVPFCAERRRALSAQFAGNTLVIPAGPVTGSLVRHASPLYRAHFPRSRITPWAPILFPIRCLSSLRTGLITTPRCTTVFPLDAARKSSIPTPTSVNSG